jgi:hypothetical protein
MSEEKMVNKYCLVPDCPNTSKNAPEIAICVTREQNATFPPED